MYHAIQYNPSQQQADSIDSYPSLSEAIQEMVNTGWEDDPIELARTVVTIHDEDTGAVAATILYAPAPFGEWPDLLVCYATGGRIKRYVRVATEDGYIPLIII